MRCRMCLKDNTYKDEIHVFEQCSAFQDERDPRGNVKFEHIYRSLQQQINAIRYYMPLIQKRNIMLDLDDNC